MAKIKKRGEAGAAKNYVTRNQALKKLQISLSDFRRLCILKGIYPREPVNKKKANKGSSAPASFYYYKDILFLLHEPLLQKFREHKTFAKKLSRALGRGEWALAKGLEDRKPVARLDHLVKERYPTFKLALQDLNDPLSLLALFERLGKNPVPGRTEVPVDVIQECGKLIAEWKIWAIKTHSLRKVFLSIKGIYYECDVPAGSGGETVAVRWLEPWEFKQTVPVDVDFRILLTFLDLYRTLTSFILFKLYTDENLVYPPPLDIEKDENGEGIGKFRLIERSAETEAAAVPEGRKISRKEVNRTIRSIKAEGATEDVEMETEEPADVDQADQETAEDFVERPSDEPAGLPTYNSLLAAAPNATTSDLLFSPYTFYISRETSSRIWEFVVRAFGGKAVMGSLDGPEADDITHVVIDRPMDPERMRAMQKDRKWTWVQPQWLADCVNQRKVLPAGEGSGYEPGATLPPHTSPWDGEGEPERPWLNAEDGSDAEDVDEADVDGQDELDGDNDVSSALAAAAANPEDISLRHQAELEAEEKGIAPATFQKQFNQAVKRSDQKKSTEEEDLRKIMMTNKKQKLYEKMKYGNAARQAEKEKLDSKRKIIEQRKKKGGRA